MARSTKKPKEKRLGERRQTERRRERRRLSSGSSAKERRTSQSRRSASRRAGIRRSGDTFVAKVQEFSSGRESKEAFPPLEEDLVTEALENDGDFENLPTEDEPGPKVQDPEQENS